MQIQMNGRQGGFHGSIGLEEVLQERLEDTKAHKERSDLDSGVRQERFEHLTEGPFAGV